MDYTTFEEGTLRFLFGKSWNVIKYDEHKYYRILSGSSFSGVDFAGVYQDKEAYFIEIKNYLQYDGSIRDSIENLTNKFGEKIKDTLRLIDIVQQYHHRKWLYRKLVSWVKIYPWLHKDWHFWTYLYELTNDASQYRFVFLIFCREQDLALFDQVTDLLRARHPKKQIIFIYNEMNILKEVVIENQPLLS